MCVIIYKPKGVQLPSLDIIERAKRFNPHGFGLCSPGVYYKGLSYDQFKRNLLKCEIDQPLLIHLRYATHGSVKKSNCHPFYHAGTETFFMHNGILDVPTYGGKTDSECAFNDIIVPVIDWHGLFSKEAETVIRRILGGSKFAFMQGENIKLFGDYIEKSGLYYSNLRFMPYSLPD